MGNLAKREIVEANTDVADGCWMWTGPKDRLGYGYFRFGNQKVRAYRAAYEVYVGEIPAGLHILHSCDNPSCVNPSHLRAGTHAENMRDKAERGRAFGAKPGMQHHKARLTSEQVVAAFYDNRPQSVIAAELRVAKSTIGDIKTGRSWLSVTKNLTRRSGLGEGAACWLLNRRTLRGGVVAVFAQEVE